MNDIKKMTLGIYEETIGENSHLTIIDDTKVTSIQMAFIVNAGLLEPNEILLDKMRVNGLVTLVMAKAFNIALNELLNRNMFEQGVAFKSEVTSSKTIFNISIPGKPYDFLTDILDCFITFDISNKTLEIAKKEAIFEMEQRVHNLSQLSLLKAAGAIYKNIDPTEVFKECQKKIRAINITILRKFYNRFYSSLNISVLFMGKVDKSLIRNILEKSLCSSSKVKVNEIETKRDLGDNNSAINNKLFQKDTKEKFSRLVLSYCFPLRKDLYDKYKDELFAIYQFLPYAVFGEKSSFSSGALKSGLIFQIHNSSVLEIGERTLLQEEMITFNPDKLVKYISDKKIKLLSNKHFNFLKKQLISIIIQNAHNFEFIRNLYLKSLSNNVRLVDFINNIDELSCKKMNCFLNDMKKYQYAIYLERGAK